MATQTLTTQQKPIRRRFEPLIFGGLIAVIVLAAALFSTMARQPAAEVIDRVPAAVVPAQVDAATMRRAELERDGWAAYLLQPEPPVVDGWALSGQHRPEIVDGWQLSGISDD